MCLFTVLVAPTMYYMTSESTPDSNIGYLLTSIMECVSVPSPTLPKVNLSVPVA